MSFLRRGVIKTTQNSTQISQLAGNSPHPCFLGVSEHKTKDLVVKSKDRMKFDDAETWVYRMTTDSSSVIHLLANENVMHTKFPGKSNFYLGKMLRYSEIVYHLGIKKDGKQFYHHEP